MIRFPYVMQECPVCGRPLEIADDLLRRRVACPHCGGSFVARENAAARVGAFSLPRTLLHRADQLLRLSERRLHQARKSPSAV
ncbi:MAG: hypothetical protein JW809_02420 [Pirellulales bacterium]|nr:hypothetical protein [Pirellulales bacterium]